jgi:hypothetical protein
LNENGFRPDHDPRASALAANPQVLRAYRKTLDSFDVRPR